MNISTNHHRPTPRSHIQQIRFIPQHRTRLIYDSHRLILRQSSLFEEMVFEEVGVGNDGAVGGGDEEG